MSRSGLCTSTMLRLRKLRGTAFEWEFVGDHVREARGVRFKKTGRPAQARACAKAAREHLAPIPKGRKHYPRHRLSVAFWLDFSRRRIARFLRRKRRRS